jgi:lipid A 4'-phosphatase
MRFFLKQTRKIFWLISGLAVFTLLVSLLNVDRRIAAFFYIPTDTLTVAGHWIGLNHPFWQTIYTLTPWPAFLLGALALIVLLLGLRLSSYAQWRKQMLFILLLFILGPGLIVNVLLKDQLGKPRPYEITDFGGTYPYAEFWQPVTQQKNASFPSGHASIAFAVVAPWFFLRNRHRRIAKAFLVGGLGWGVIVGLTRIAQGGHFLSDVVWAAGLVYLTGEMLALCFAFDRPLASENNED